MPSSATGVGMPICLLGGVLLILTQKNSQKFGDVLGILYTNYQLASNMIPFIDNHKIRAKKGYFGDF